MRWHQRKFQSEQAKNERKLRVKEKIRAASCYVVKGEGFVNRTMNKIVSFFKVKK